MRNGTQPLSKPPKREFHRNFGGVTLAQIPDFNLDAGLWMPDQDADGAFTECTGYTVTDIKSDWDKRLYSPDWQFAKTLQLANVSPLIGAQNGADIHIAMQSAVVFGSLEAKMAPFTALLKGEQFVADINNWPFSPLNTEAIINAEIGTYNALGNGDAFSSILSAAYVNKMGVSVGTPWYQEWEQIGAGLGKMVPGNGIVSMPSDINDAQGLAPWHNWVIKGKKTIAGVEYAIGKSWQGKKYGDGGFHYIPREIINAVFAVSGTGAISFADNGSRFINLLIIFFSQTPQGLAILPEVLASSLGMESKFPFSKRPPSA